MITFVSSNKDKIIEVKQILGEINSQSIDTNEIRGTITEIVTQKARDACRALNQPVIVDDTSLCINALDGLPGPYIGIFIKQIGAEKVHKMVSSFEDKSATAICMIGYCEPGKDPVLFEGKIDGKIVSSRGSGFGWDPIFEVDQKTFAEMSKDEKNKISHRYKALIKLKAHIDGLH